MTKTLNLGEQLTAARHIRKGPPCAIKLVLAQLSAADAEALVGALGDPSLGHTTIHRVLMDNGFKMSINTVQRHRRGECLCDPR